jgi:uncharacterized protein YbjT (DUF2867 family)
MKVAIAGGHGKIAMHLASKLHERGDTVLSIIRKEDQSGDVESVGAEPVVCDLEQVDSTRLAGSISSVDAVVFAAGAGPGSGSERKETVDHLGAVKLIDAAKANGISRYVMISSIGADASARGDDTFAAYLRAKGRADETLIDSGLDYTIVRPTRLTDEPGRGRILIGRGLGRSSIPREDVAMVVAIALNEPSALGKVFEVAAGSQPIAEAIRSL